MSAVLVLAAIAAAPAGASAQVSSEMVKAAVRKGVAHIRLQQRGNGHWSDYGGHSGGMTALCLLAMLNAGVPPEDPDVARGLKAMASVPNQRTYVVSLKAQAFAAAYDAAEPDNPNLNIYYKQVKEAATWLAAAQLNSGMWTYIRRRGGGGAGDNSNTQFALLGIHEAANLRPRGTHEQIRMPEKLWARSRGHFERTQGDDGGWGYTPRNGSYGSMTTAGAASLYICGLRLNVGGRKQFVKGAYPDCGKYTQYAPLAKGLNWLTRNFSVRDNPRRGATYHHYYLYGLERVGAISGRRNFGRHDWYRQGAAHLVATQKPNGRWGRQLHQTAFSVLFLAKGNRPVLIQKVQFNGRWNRNIHDLENLCTFIGDKLGENVTWQTTSLASPVEELMASPILYITGHEFPDFTDAEKDKLGRFVRSGGTLLFEACCGSDKFTEGFRALARELWGEYPLRNISAAGPARHPVWDSYYSYDEHFAHLADRIGNNYGLQGIDAGCRTSVFFSPRALSCLWELQDIAQWSEFAYKLGVNIAAYATGREALANKLETVELPADDEAEKQPAEIPRGAVRIARLIHNGEYNCDPHCMVNLARMLRDKAKVDVFAKARHLRADDKKIFEYPVLFTHGHQSFQLSRQEIENLRLYLQRGGVLVACACCGRRAFDASFREMVRQLYPPGTKDSQDNLIALESLPRDHPILSGKVGVKLGELRYRKMLAEELKQIGVPNWRGTQYPNIEAAVIDGSARIIYSKYDFSCALEGDRPYSCRGYQEEDGKKLALNIFLYAISY
jgi:hypothetical protein